MLEIHYESDVGASTSFFMPDQDNPAIKALQFLAEKYSPATAGDADTFLTTTEISQAISQHTGSVLSNAEVLTVMEYMKYSYNIYNQLDFTWLMKKK